VTHDQRAPRQIVSDLLCTTSVPQQSFVLVSGEALQNRVRIRLGETKRRCSYKEAPPSGGAFLMC
jgi:hypothetical protein